MEFSGSIDRSSGIDDARKIPETRIILTDFGGICPVCLKSTILYRCSLSKKIGLALT